MDQKVLVDNSIAGAEFHTHQPLTTRYENNDEIRIPLQDDLCTLPSESYIFIVGSLKKKPVAATPTTPATTPAGVPNAKFCNNGIAFLFSSIRYEVNGVTVDNTTNPGITTSMKGYVSLSPNESRKFQNGGWYALNDSTLIDDQGNFNACVPLRHMLGFAEDYPKVMVNIKQELILVRSNSDKNATVGPEEAVVSISTIYWKVPHIHPGLKQELYLTNQIKKGIDIQIAFRNWQLHVFPSINQTKTHTWAVSTMDKTSTPRYIILGFQTMRDNDHTKDASKFDGCNFENIRVFLNNDRYPYDNVNIDFGNHKVGTLYEMYSAFQSSYYRKESEPLLNIQDFLKTPLIVVDTSKQKEHLQPSSITLRIEFDTSENVPANTAAYCLVLHDRIFSYNPLTKIVKQV